MAVWWRDPIRRGGRSVAATALALGLVAAGAAAQERDPAREREVLVLTPPTNWELAAQQRGPAMYVIQYVPPGQSADNWSEMVQAQIFYRMTGLPPDRFLANMLALYQGNCDPVAAAAPQTAIIGGYAVASQVLACGRNNDDRLGALAMFKVIQGREAFYAINRAWRGAPYDPLHLPVSAATLAEWSAFLARVRLCDNRNPEAPCPARPAE